MIVLMLRLDFVGIRKWISVAGRIACRFLLSCRFEFLIKIIDTALSTSRINWVAAIFDTPSSDVH